MHRELSTIPLPSNVRYKLNLFGLTSSDDLLNYTPVNLSKDAEISVEEAVEVLKYAFPEKYGGNSEDLTSISALDLLRKEEETNYIVTFCEKLDDTLGGGISLGKLTELCGAPGVGKTQLCFQLSINVHLPGIVGGVDGDCIYIDTEGSFMIERLNEITKYTVDHCKNVCEMQDDAAFNESMKTFTAEQILKGIHIYRCTDYVELMATINILPEFLNEHAKVRLLIIDSIAFPFRHDFDGNMALRTRLLNGLSQLLFKMAVDYNLAVVLTNQMTSRIDEKQGLTLVPALGESWGHVCTNRILLSWNDERRYARLYKSPSHQDAVVPYVITAAGIRDVASEDEMKK